MTRKAPQHLKYLDVCRIIDAIEIDPKATAKRIAEDLDIPRAQVAKVMRDLALRLKMRADRRMDLYCQKLEGLMNLAVDVMARAMSEEREIDAQSIQAARDTMDRVGPKRSELPPELPESDEILVGLKLVRVEPKRYAEAIERGA